MATAAELRQQADIEEAAEKEVVRLAEIKRQEEERAERGWSLRASDELRKLTKEVEAVLAQGPTDRPRVECRALARAFLYGLPNTDSAGLLDRLVSVDARLGQLLGTQRKVGQAQIRASEHSDGALNDALDALECSAWAAVARRIHWLAGEAE